MTHIDKKKEITIVFVFPTYIRVSWMKSVGRIEKTCHKSLNLGLKSINEEIITAITFLIDIHVFWRVSVGKIGTISQ